jgi:hypothetical protein
VNKLKLLERTRTPHATLVLQKIKLFSGLEK